MNLNMDISPNHDKRTVPYLKLWWAVLLQAINDATGEGTGHMSRRVVLDWFDSNNRNVCSFVWICDTLDLNSEYVRANVFRLDAERQANEAKIKRYIVKNPERREMIQKGEAKLQIVDGKVKFVLIEKKPKKKRVKNDSTPSDAKLG
jgi:hypothetical protein